MWPGLEWSCGVRSDGGAAVVKRAHEKLRKWFWASCVMEVTLQTWEFSVSLPIIFSSAARCAVGVCTHFHSGKGSSLGEEVKQLAQVPRLRVQSHAVRLVDGLGEMWAQGLVGGRIGKILCQLDGGCGAAPPGGPGVETGWKRSVHPGRTSYGFPFGTRAFGCGQLSGLGAGVEAGALRLFLSVGATLATREKPVARGCFVPEVP